MTATVPPSRRNARRACRRLSPVLLALAAAALPAAGVAEPAAATSPKPQARAAASGGDNLDRLRERLAEKLGASKPSDALQPSLLRVTARAEGPAAADERHAARSAPPRKPAAAAAATVDAHRADKANGSGGPWSYAGETGPAAWGGLKPQFATCANGRRQSPIDIRGGIAVDLEPVRFDYRASAFSVLNNGHTVQALVGAGNFIEVRGRRFELQQFHFHRPSEERINGRQFDMSVHLVHQDAEGRLAVVALLLERGAAQPVVQRVWNDLPLEQGETQPAAHPVDLAELLPADRGYYTYMGSLTTPPCTEDVLWMVMRQPLPVSQAQIDIFSRLYPMNARPLQAAAGRLIKQSQ